MPTARANRRKNRTTLFTFVVLLVGFLVINFAMVVPYCIAVVMGGILALITRPLYQRLLTKMGPKFSAGIVTAAITIIIIGPVLLFTALAVDQAIEVGNTLSKSEGFSLPAISHKLLSFKPVRTVVGDEAAMDKQLKTGIQGLGKTISAGLLGAAGLLPDFFIQLILALIACFFLLIDGKRLFAWLKDKIPLDTDIREHIFSSFKETAASTMWATMAAATVQSTIMFLAFLVLSVPATFLAAGATFFLAWVPIIGSAPVWIGGAIYLYAEGSLLKAIVMLGFGLLTSLSDNVVYPLVLKGKADMHPLVGLVAIFGGIQMFGIPGVFIGPILTAILIALLEVWPEVRERFGVGEPATVEPVTEKIKT